MEFKQFKRILFKRNAEVKHLQETVAQLSRARWMQDQAIAQKDKFIITTHNHVMMLNQCVQFERNTSHGLREEVRKMKAELEKVEGEGRQYYQEWVEADQDATKGMEVIEQLKDNEEIYEFKNMKMEANLKAAQAMVEDLNKQNNTLSKALTSREAHIQQLINENDMMSKVVASKNARVQHLENEKDMMSKVIASREACVESTLESHLVLEEKLGQKRIQNNSLKNVLRYTRSQVKLLEKENEMLVTDNAPMREEVMPMSNAPPGSLRRRSSDSLGKKRV